MSNENKIAICNHGYKGCTVFGIIDKDSLPKFLEDNKEALEEKKKRVPYQSLTILSYSELIKRDNYKLDLIN